MTRQPVLVACFVVLSACNRSESTTANRLDPPLTSQSRISAATTAGEARASGSDASISKPMEVGGEVTPPIVIKRVEPHWPETVSRDVLWVFSAVVTKKGRVKDVRLEKGQPGLYSRAAETAIKQWHFKPATYRGKAVDVKYNLSVRIHVR